MGPEPRDLKRLDEALTSYDKVLLIKPDYAEAYYNRGNTLGELGRYDEALASYDKAISIQSNYAAAFYIQGVMLQELKRFDEAVESYDNAISIKSDYVEALNNRGNALSELRRFEEALKSYDKSISIRPNYAEAFFNRATALKELKRLDEALVSYDKAISVKSYFSEAFNNRGVTLGQLKRFDEALESYDNAISINPNYVAAFNSRGNILKELKRFDEALQSYDAAISIKSDYVEAINNRGNTLREMQRLDEALFSFDKAIAIDPNFIEAFYDRGILLYSMKRFDEALKSYEAAFLINEEFKQLRGARVQASLFSYNWDNLNIKIEDLNKAVGEHKGACTPFMFLSINDSPDMFLRLVRSQVDDVKPKPVDMEFAPFKNDHARIRLGYLSADFREHPIAQALSNIISLHDRSRFEVIGISIGPRDASEIANRLINEFDVFRDARNMRDMELKKLIQDLQIDILLTTAIWTEYSRKELLNYRCAPAQVNFLSAWTSGYGLNDYIIADPRGILPDEKHHFSEKIVYLRGFANDTNQKMPTDKPERAFYGLPENSIVFCCFNQPYKINPEMFDRWMNILGRVEGSVLWLKYNTVGNDRLLAEAGRRNIEPSRIVFAPTLSSISDHFARLSLADLTLDTLPFGGHTTMRDSLYAGVPIITQTGRSFVGRIGTILLEDAGLPELVCRTAEEYENLAVALALDSTRLRGIREKLKRNRLTQRLFDSRQYVLDLEAAYEAIYHRHKNGLPPEHIDLETIENFRKNGND